MVAAFDYQNQIKTGDKKLLFLAHRKEILDQSLYTFRNVFILDSMDKYLTDMETFKALGFCVSIKHADLWLMALIQQEYLL